MTLTCVGVFFERNQFKGAGPGRAREPSSCAASPCIVVGGLAPDSRDDRVRHPTSCAARTDPGPAPTHLE
jgi:hypothetical protein